MVTGWEELTKELTPFEKEQIYPRVLRSWEKKSLEEYVNMSDMIKAINETAIKLNWRTKRGKEYKITGPRVRKIIHVLRVSGDLPNLIANSKGYFKTNDKEKIRNFIASCRERANSFKEVADCMQVYNFER